jgi:hypothetical protein
MIGQINTSTPPMTAVSKRIKAPAKPSIAPRHNQNPPPMSEAQSRPFKRSTNDALDSRQRMRRAKAEEKSCTQGVIRASWARVLCLPGNQS